MLLSLLSWVQNPTKPKNEHISISCKQEQNLSNMYFNANLAQKKPDLTDNYIVIIYFVIKTLFSSQRM